MARVPEESPRSGRSRRATATADFGSGRRESHDASAFYDRFVPPEISSDATVNQPAAVDVIHHHDARDMTAVPSKSVALVVTSPPYFAGKQYEQSLGRNGVPATYFEYLELLRDVFSECKRVLEPGGRIAVNVANLGRRPYRSLSADVTGILADLGLLLRGEVIWWKGRAAGGSCAWGTFQHPTNPVLRDVTERIIVASKGRFDRAITPRDRHRAGLPSTVTISREEFMEATTDLWELPTESATRVGHPAPFPVELPQRLIDLYTYEGDVVLDPFMGSGSTAVAAVRSGRHYIGFDTDASYIALATERIASEGTSDQPHRAKLTVESAGDESSSTRDPEVARRNGRSARELAEIMIEAAGFTDITTRVKPRGTGVEVDVVAHDPQGRRWGFLVSGGFTATRSGLRRAETVWRSLGQASVLHTATDLRVVLLSTDLPARSSPTSQALQRSTGDSGPIRAVIDISTDDAIRDLADLAHGGAPTGAPTRHARHG